MNKPKYTFDYVFEDYDDFQEYCQANNIYDTSSAELNTYNKWIYKALYFKFMSVPFLYEDPRIWLNEFTLVLLDRWKEYKQQKELIEEIYKLQIEDFAKTKEGIISNATSNNQNLTDPTKFVSYVTDQTYSGETLSKFQGYTDAIHQIPSYNIAKFLSHFTYLFKTMFSKTEQCMYEKNKDCDCSFHLQCQDGSIICEELEPNNWKININEGILYNLRNDINNKQNTLTESDSIKIDKYNKNTISLDESLESKWNNSSDYTERIEKRIEISTEDEKLIEYNRLDNRSFDELNEYQIPQQHQIKDYVIAHAGGEGSGINKIESPQKTLNIDLTDPKIAKKEDKLKGITNLDEKLQYEHPPEHLELNDLIPKSFVDDELDKKQDILVNQKNIASINNKDLTKGGNIDINLTPQLTNDELIKLRALLDSTAFAYAKENDKKYKKGELLQRGMFTQQVYYSELEQPNDNIVTDENGKELDSVKRVAFHEYSGNAWYTPKTESNENKISLRDYEGKLTYFDKELATKEYVDNKVLYLNYNLTDRIETINLNFSEQKDYIVNIYAMSSEFTCFKFSFNINKINNYPVNKDFEISSITYNQDLIDLKAHIKNLNPGFRLTLTLQKSISEPVFITRYEIIKLT